MTKKPAKAKEKANIELAAKKLQDSNFGAVSVQPKSVVKEVATVDATVSVESVLAPAVDYVVDPATTEVKSKKKTTKKTTKKTAKKSTTKVKEKPNFKVAK